LALQKARNPDRLGTAHFRAGDFDKAVDAFAQASSPDGHYNRGNSLARLGLLQEAVGAYDQALAQAPGMEDALYNQQQVEELLQRQAQSRQEQQDRTPSDAQNQEGEQGQDQQQRRQQAQGEDPQQPHEKDQQGEERESGQTQAPDSRASQPQPAGARTDDGQAPRPEGPANAGQQTQEHQAPARADDQAAATANAGKDDPEQARRELAKAMQQTGDANAEETPEQADTGHPSASEDHLDSEERQVMEQWLRRIPDDPGGLLRRKFLYQYARRAAGRNTGSADPW
jgi:Ca-activated chloride channel family protein